MKNVDDMTRDELRAEAKELQVPGRGSMKADELREAVRFERAQLEVRADPASIAAVRPDAPEWTELGRTDEGATVYFAPVGTPAPEFKHSGRIQAAPMPPLRDRYRDRVRRGELVVRTPNGQAPALFLAGATPRTFGPSAPTVVPPMSTKTRIMHYVVQNSTHKLTMRQERQIRRMTRRMAPAT